MSTLQEARETLSILQLSEVTFLGAPPPVDSLSLPHLSKLELLADDSHVVPSFLFVIRDIPATASVVLSMLADMFSDVHSRFTTCWQQLYPFHFAKARFEDGQAGFTETSHPSRFHMEIRLWGAKGGDPRVREYLLNHAALLESVVVTNTATFPFEPNNHPPFRELTVDETSLSDTMPKLGKLPAGALQRLERIVFSGRMRLNTYADVDSPGCQWLDVPTPLETILSAFTWGQGRPRHTKLVLGPMVQYDDMVLGILRSLFSEVVVESRNFVPH